MTVYIPVSGILYFLTIHAIIGLFMFTPMLFWTDRFMSNYKFDKRAGIKRHPYASVNWPKAFLAAMTMWPILLGYCIKTEIEYRKKGYL